MFGGGVCTYSIKNNVLKITGTGTFPEPTSIPGYDNITRIECNNNGLRSLPDLPQNLKVLLCASNSL
jgi:hypothetical protein